MLEMEKAWDKGISPYQFRKSRMDDLNFIFEMKAASREMEKEMKKDKEHEANVKKTLNLIRSGPKL